MVRMRRTRLMSSGAALHKVTHIVLRNFSVLDQICLELKAARASVPRDVRVSMDLRVAPVSAVSARRGQYLRLKISAVENFCSRPNWNRFFQSSKKVVPIDLRAESFTTRGTLFRQSLRVSSGPPIQALPAAELPTNSWGLTWARPSEPRSLRRRGPDGVRVPEHQCVFGMSCLAQDGCMHPFQTSSGSGAPSMAQH